MTRLRLLRSRESGAAPRTFKEMCVVRAHSFPFCIQGIMAAASAHSTTIAAPAEKAFSLVHRSGISNFYIEPKERRVHGGSYHTNTTPISEYSVNCYQYFSNILSTSSNRCKMGEMHPTLPLGAHPSCEMKQMQRRQIISLVDEIEQPRTCAAHC